MGGAQMAAPTKPQAGEEKQTAETSPDSPISKNSRLTNSNRAEAHQVSA